MLYSIFQEPYVKRSYKRKFIWIRSRILVGLKLSSVFYFQKIKDIYVYIYKYFIVQINIYLKRMKDSLN